MRQALSFEKPQGSAIYDRLIASWASPLYEYHKGIAATGNPMKPIVLFSSLAALCAAGLLALSYQGWRDDESVVTALNQPAGSAVQTVSGEPSSAPETPQQAAPEQQVAAVQPDQPPASADVTQPATEGAPAATGEVTPGAVVPTFDMVRIEEDGSAVLAGRAEPGATVTALLDGKPIGEEVVNERGEWVIVPSGQVPSGAHQMTLQQTLPSGTVNSSDQTVAFTVPDQPGTQPLIVLSETSQPTRVLQKPEAEAAQATPTQQPAVETAQADQPVAPASGGGQPAKADAGPSVAPAPDTQDTQVAVLADPAAPAEPAAPAVQDASRNLNLDVVDYDESGRTIFSGTAKAGTTVRVYVGSLYAGETTAGEDGRWNLTAQNDIPAGTYALRADAVGGEGKVAERIEMPFLRESPERVAALQQQRQAGSGTGAVTEQDTGMSQAAAPASETPQDATGQASEPQPAEPQVAAAPEAQSEPAATAGPATSAAEPQTGELLQAGEVAASSEQSEQVAATAAPEAQPAASAEPAAADPNQPGKVVIQPGNNLWQISRVIYGKGVQYTVIYEANKSQIRDPDLIYPGQIFETPGSQAPESIDPSCRAPLDECKAMQEQAEQGAAQ
jgi:nucleoid-associated protein YgaU